MHWFDTTGSGRVINASCRGSDTDAMNGGPEGHVEKSPLADALPGMDVTDRLSIEPNAGQDCTNLRTANETLHGTAGNAVMYDATAGNFLTLGGSISYTNHPENPPGGAINTAGYTTGGCRQL